MARAAASSKTRQVQQLVSILNDHDGKTFDHESLKEVLTDPRLATRQDPYLIFKYYQRELIDLGILIIDKVRAAARMSRYDMTDGAGI